MRLKSFVGNVKLKIYGKPSGENVLGEDNIDYIKIYKLQDMIENADKKTQQKMFDALIQRLLEDEE